MKWLSVDPGEATGWAIWEDEELLDAGTTPMWEFADALFDAIIFPGQLPGTEDDYEELVWLFQGFERVVCEDWTLYPWKLRNGEMDWNKCRTARLIGAITQMCRKGGVDFVLQPAKIKDGAEAAGAETLFMSPLHENRHANDAIRHGTWYCTFNGDPERMQAMLKKLRTET